MPQSILFNCQPTISLNLPLYSLQSVGRFLSTVCPPSNLITAFFTASWPTWLVSHSFISDWLIEKSSLLQLKNTSWGIYMSAHSPGQLPAASINAAMWWKWNCCQGLSDHLGIWHRLFPSTQVGTTAWWWMKCGPWRQVWPNLWQIPSQSISMTAVTWVMGSKNSYPINWVSFKNHLSYCNNFGFEHFAN